MSDNQFKVGDVVQLKSGSVQMTVVRECDDGKLECKWFEPSTNKFCVEQFEPVVLQKPQYPAPTSI